MILDRDWVKENYHNEETISLPENAKIIGSGAFEWCINLKSITIPEGVERIEDDAFYGCKSLKSVNMPDSLISIGNRAFAACADLDNVRIPNGVSWLGGHSFEGCKNLKEIELPKLINEIRDFTFSQCTSLEHIELPNSIRTIYPYAFVDCKNLKDITFGIYITGISDSAFADRNDSLTFHCPSDSYPANYAEILNINRIFTDEEDLMKFEGAVRNCEYTSNHYGTAFTFQLEDRLSDFLLLSAIEKHDVAFKKEDIKCFELFECDDESPMIIIDFNKPYRYKEKEYYSFSVEIGDVEKERLISEVHATAQFRFNKNAFVICKGEHEDRDKSFDIYAKVLEADRHNDVLCLDCYQDYGKYHYGIRRLSLSHMESEGLYKPMNNEERSVFCKNLEDSKSLDLTKNQCGGRK